MDYRLWFAALRLLSYLYSQNCFVLYVCAFQKCIRVRDVQHDGNTFQTIKGVWLVVVDGDVCHKKERNPVNTTQLAQQHTVWVIIVCLSLQSNLDLVQQELFCDREWKKRKGWQNAILYRPEAEVELSIQALLLLGLIFSGQRVVWYKLWISTWLSVDFSKHPASSKEREERHGH